MNLSKHIKEEIKWEIYEVLAPFEGKVLTPRLIEHARQESARAAAQVLRRSGSVAHEDRVIRFSREIADGVISRYLKNEGYGG